MPNLLFVWQRYKIYIMQLWWCQRDQNKLTCVVCNGSKWYKGKRFFNMYAFFLNKVSLCIPYIYITYQDTINQRTIYVSAAISFFLSNKTIRYALNTSCNTPSSTVYILTVCKRVYKLRNLLDNYNWKQIQCESKNGDILNNISSKMS